MPNYTFPVTVKLTKQQKDRLTSAAARAGMPVAEFHRKVLIESLDLKAETRLSLRMQASIGYFVKQIIIDWLVGSDLTPERIARLESESLTMAGRLADRFMESQK